MTEQMTCQEYRSHLDEWLDGELSQDLAAAMHAHRETCAECAEETRLAEEALAMIRTLEPEEPVPLNVQASWRSAVRKEAKQRTRLHWGAGMRAVSSIAASVIVLAGCTIGFRSAGILDAYPAKVTAVQADAMVQPAAAVPEDSLFRFSRSAAGDMPYTYVASDSAADTASLTLNGSAAEAETEESAEIMLCEDTAPMALEEAVSAEADMLAETPAVYETFPDAGDEAAEPQQDRLLIRSAARTICTNAFDSDAQNVRNLTEQYDGYVAVDSVTVQPNGSRIAEIECVLPAVDADSFLQTLDHIGEITFSAEYFRDITAEVQDVSEQAAAYQAEIDLLNVQIADASADELPALKTQLQDMLTQKDALQTQSNRLSSDLEHVHVTVRLEELLTPGIAEPTIAPSLPERMSSAFIHSAENLRTFTHDMLISLMVIAPFLCAGASIIAVIALIVWLFRRRK